MAKAGVPIEAVLSGVDAAFERFRSRPSVAAMQSINSLAYCRQAVAAEAKSSGDQGRAFHRPQRFSDAHIRAYISANAARLRAAGRPEFAEMLDQLDVDDLGHDLERFEERLIEIEEMMVAHLSQTVTLGELEQIGSELDPKLEPYRNKMTAKQLAMLEQKFIERKLLESASLPRLSPFYL